MTENLLIIESVGKIKKLSSILGPSWTIKASFGHIRELARDGDSALGFDLIGDRVSCRFQPTNSRARDTIAQLRGAVKNADNVYLGTDPDREGETIAWHLAEVLELKNPTRVVYSEITPGAVKGAIANPSLLDRNMVGAGLARACLDKLVGFKGSPLVWRLNNGAKSIGRVQSAALHLLCDREREIKTFISTPYWSVFVDYKEGFRAFYLSDKEGNAADSTLDNSSEDAKDPQDKKKAESSKVLSQHEADRLVQIAKTNHHKIVKVEEKTVFKKPPPPFITSSLQQAAGSRLKFSPKKTMEIAQSLYEKGLITYMRTDSVVLSLDFCAAARDWLSRKDPSNIPDKQPTHRNKKTAQSAHEAIRPTDVNKPSSELKRELSNDEFQLYLLIWLRSIASLCRPAKLRKTSIVSRSGDISWVAKGSLVEFLGYGKYWKNLDGEVLLPEVVMAQQVNLENANSEEKVTQPPRRYSEPKLVAVMERKGIGRPSTYAPTVKTLKERKYATLVKGILQPTGLGLEVDEFLGLVLSDLLEAAFTAEMEGKLDAIAAGEENWEKYLTAWNQNYFEGAIARANEYLDTNGYPQNIPRAKKELEISDIRCPKCDQHMRKVPSSSKNLDLPYFLKCSQCKVGTKDLVMFYNQKGDQWVQPADKTSSASNDKPTDYDCPVCKQKLVEHSYIKDGQTKKMLRCAAANNSKRKHKDVAYFWTKNGTWWNKKYGELD